jgi:hypothetical protein
MNEPIKVFLSYSHKDEELRQELISHLSGLQHQGLIEPWHDRDISAGSEWADQIDQNLEQADIILFLVSADFINSRYCYSIEMKRALERHRAKTACTIPVIIRDCDWKSTDLHQLNGIPRDNRHVTGWGDDKYARDSAWTEVSKEIGKVANQIRDKRNLESSETQKSKKSQEFRSKVSESLKLDLNSANRENQNLEAKNLDLDLCFQENLDLEVILEMMLIPGGKFFMGSSNGEGYDDEYPRHEVEIPEFYMSKFLVTQEQWKAVTFYVNALNKSPSFYLGDLLPVESVNWFEASKFCKELSIKTGKRYRLPTESEWEYACRARTESTFSWGKNISVHFMNHGSHYDQTTEVARFQPNNFGLCDMHCNVWEWCSDM